MWHIRPKQPQGGLRELGQLCVLVVVVVPQIYTWVKTQRTHTKELNKEF